MGIGPRFDVELEQNLKPKGAGLIYKVAGSLRPVLVLSGILLCLCLYENFREGLVDAPLFRIVGSLAALMFLVGALCLMLAVFLLSGNSEPGKLVWKLLPAGSQDMQVFLAILFGVILVLRFADRVLKRAYVNYKLKVFLVQMLLGVDLLLWKAGGQEALLNLTSYAKQFFKTF